jgi:hypothetical protein
MPSKKSTPEMLPSVNPGDEMVDTGVELPEMEDFEVIENPDGSATVVEKGPEEKEIGDFDQNLAEVFDSAYLAQLGTKLKDLVDKDVEDRKKRDEQYSEGIRRTGLGNDAPGGAEFEGSSKAVHPMLAKGSVDFASRAIKELFPAGGPCKTQIIGEQTEEKLDRAERKKKYMNWQCTTQIQENRAELERLLSQVPLGGAQYKRWWWDPELKRPRTEAVFIDNVFIPYGQADFYTSPRVAFRQLISKDEFEKRVRTGLYREDTGLEKSGGGLLGSSDLSKAQTASDKVEGVDDSNALVYNEDGLRLVWQIEINHDELEDPLADRPAPYIIHLDDSSSTILGYFRNWKEDDDRMRKIDWMTEWQFIPWRGGPAIGLAHLIGSLAAASTGALRAILDTAHIQNFPGAVKLAGARGAGESKQVSPTEISEIDAPTGVDDIRKVIMPFPFNGPSVVLFQVMEWLTQQAETVVATASEKIADASNNMPVGTALALIEHGSTNFSAVHARLHAALKRDLEIQHRLNADNMDDEETVEELGELVVRREDFMGPMDIIPVSDPNIFSEAQRYAQLQAIIQLKGDPSFTQYFKPDQLLARALKLLNVPDIEGIANLPKETKRLSPLEENYALAMQERPLKVYPDQDDLSHLKSHIQFATSPMFGANPLIASSVMPGMLQHCKEHLMALYRKHTKAATEQFLAEARARGIPIEDEEAQLYGAAFADKLLAETLGPMVMPGLEAMQKIVDEISKASAPQPDPTVAMQVNAQKEIEANKLALQKEIKMSEFNLKGMIEQSITSREEADRRSTEGLAQLATSVQLIRDQQTNGSKQMLAEFQAVHQTQLTVLTKVLDAALGQMQQAQAATVDEAKKNGNKTNVILPNGLDLATDLLQPLLGSLQQTLAESISGMQSGSSPMTQMIIGLAQQQRNFEQILQEQAASTQQAFGVIAQGLAQISQQASQPFESEIYVDANGNKRGRRVPAAPPPQLPNQQPPQGMQP